jgi:hypothetical protein
MTLDIMSKLISSTRTMAEQRREVREMVSGLLYALDPLGALSKPSAQGRMG